jgi:uncharacterized protein
MPAAAPSPTEADSPIRARRSPVPVLVLAALVGMAAGDALRPVPRQWSARAAVKAIDLYRTTVSPLLGRSGLVVCRFQPTCSAYGREAITRYGSPRGFALAAGRILRCHPWAKGGWDPVP